METWPDFVIEVEDRQSCLTSRRAGSLTGWETVVFEVEDAQGSDLGSVFSTTATHESTVAYTG